MTVLKIEQFSGETPRSNPARLPDGAASYAENCDFTDGTLRGLPANEAPAKPFAQGTKDSFLYDEQHQYAFAYDIDAARHPGANLKDPRWFLTSEDSRAPLVHDIETAVVNPHYISVPDNGQLLGVPAPRSAPVLSADHNPFGHLVAAVVYYNANEHEDGNHTDKVRVQTINQQYVNGTLTYTPAINTLTSRKGHLIADPSYTRIDKGGEPTLDILRSYGLNYDGAANKIMAVNVPGYGCVKKGSLYLSNTLTTADWYGGAGADVNGIYIPQVGSDTTPTIGTPSTSKLTDPVDAVYADNFTLTYFKLPAGRSSPDRIDGVINPIMAGDTAITIDGVSTTIMANGGLPFVRCESRPGEPSPSRWYYSLVGYQRKVSASLGPGVTESQKQAMLAELRRSPVVLNCAESTGGRVSRGPVMIADIWLAREATAEDNIPGATPGQWIDSEFVNSGDYASATLKQEIVRQRFTKVTAILRDNPEHNTWPAELPEFSMRIEWGGERKDSSGTLLSTAVPTDTDKVYQNYVVHFIGKAKQMEARAYVYTYVNTWGEEGPPSPPLFLTDVPENGTVKLQVKLPAWEPYRYCARPTIRVYRTATGTSTDFMFVDEVTITPSTALTPATRTDVIYRASTPTTHETVTLKAYELVTGKIGGQAFHLVNVASALDTTRFSDATLNSLEFSLLFRDSKRNDQLGETLATQNYYPPLFVDKVTQASTNAGKPRQLRGLIAIHGGMMAAFERNNVWISEPYLPYAWNPSAVQALPEDVVGICAADNAIYVTTIYGAYVISGESPETMTNMRITAQWPGVSRRSIASFGSTVVYASTEGLVFMRGLNASMDVSDMLFTKIPWQTMWSGVIDKLRMGVMDNALLLYVPDNFTAPVLLRKDGNALVMTHYAPTTPITAAFNVKDDLYVVEGANVRRFAASKVDTREFYYRSRHFDLPAPVSFSVVQVEGYGEATIRVYSGFDINDTELLSHQIASQQVSLDGQTTLRLPGNTKSRRWMVEVDCAANAYIYKIVLASAMSELKSV